ncbi:MAG TPA: hypothetical protein VKK31_01565 [Thermoanaerobaculia bacterium]|nr:hypothetical protein [Thermoanaerobaculia bacterium]
MIATIEKPMNVQAAIDELITPEPTIKDPSVSYNVAQRLITATVIVSYVPDPSAPNQSIPKIVAPIIAIPKSKDELDNWTVLWILKAGPGFSRDFPPVFHPEEGITIPPPPGGKPVLLKPASVNFIDLGPVRENQAQWRVTFNNNVPSSSEFDYGIGVIPTTIQGRVLPAFFHDPTIMVASEPIDG